MEEKSSETEVLPLDRYIRAVAICNSLALLASQGTMAQYIQRIAILAQLQKYWKKGYDTVTLSCADYDDGKDDDDNSPDETVDDASIALQAAAALASAEQPDNWETHSNSTVDLKPDIHAMASEPELSEPEEKPERKSHKKSTDADRPKRGRKPGRGASSQIYPCSKCGETFKYRSVLVRHENQKHKSTEDKVGDTDDVKQADETQPAVTTKETAYTEENHQPVEALNDPRRCKVCGMIFSKVSVVKMHMNLHTGERPFKCSFCDKRFIHPTSCRTHELMHTEGCEHKCNTCGGVFKSKRNLNLHIETHHNTISSHVCEKCGKAFKAAMYLQDHIRAMHGNTKHVCEQCGKPFKIKRQLRLHRRRFHMKERRYVCSECPAMFQQSGDLKRHKMAKHSDEKLFRCDVCSRTFALPYSLNMHMRTHTGEKPHHCPICGQRFAQLCSAKRHIEMHIKQTANPAKTVSESQIELTS